MAHDAGMDDARPRLLVVDAANVVGARPDGWWRDRAGAAERLLAALATAITAGATPDLADRRVVVVLEGRALAAADDAARRHPGLEVVRAPRDGDAAIVELVAAHPGHDVVVITSDRELRRRVTARGATVRGAGWLRDLLDG